MTRENEIPEDLISTQEAIQLFANAQISGPTFHRWVREGIIHRYLPEGQKRGGKYSKAALLAAIQSRGDKYRRSPSRVSTPLHPTIFSQATPPDMVDIAPLLETFYTAKISVPKRAAWIERNPSICFLLRSQANVVGCAFIMPLSEEKIQEILSSQVKPPTRPEDIDEYQEGKHYSLYVRAVGVLQKGSKRQRKHWAAQLILGLVRSVVALGEQGIYLDSIYAQGDSPAGERVLRGLGFFQIDIPAPTNRRNYCLPIARSGAPFTMLYKARLSRWREQNEGE